MINRTRSRPSEFRVTDTSDSVKMLQLLLVNYTTIDSSTAGYQAIR